MGFTNSSETRGTYARILLKDQLGFQIGKKNGETWENKLYDVVSGEFIKIETGSYKTEEGEERELVKIHLRDDSIGEIIVSSAWTGVARNLINSFAGDSSLGVIEMGLYKKQGKDGKYYPNIRLKNNKEQMKWKYSIEDQNKYIEVVKFKGQDMRDFSKFEEVLKGEFDNINKKSKYEAKEIVKNIEDEPELPF